MERGGFVGNLFTSLYIILYDTFSKKSKASKIQVIAS